MTNAELILKLVEMLIEAEKKQQAEKANGQNGQSRDYYITNHKGIVTSICYSFIFMQNKRDAFFHCTSF